ncbi:hypothetical protein HB911_09365 [Listeria booriae]|uniref:murein biosynthesis integral membrane protein MurJ n=1 Tax=Listeria booriae TaxID=1552123 RepID=UPI00162660E2|nr:lipid II flippase MurJ [Listeria booriae]MBC1558909.1 hypothetical protein [Listeria booriae]
MKPQKRAKVFGVMLLLTLSTQLIGLFKNTLLAQAFGVGSAMDAYNLANTYVVAITNLAIPAIIIVLIPILAKEQKTRYEASGIDSYITFLIAVITTLIIIVNIGSFLTIQLGALTTEMRLFIEMTCMISIAQVFRVYTSILTSYRQVVDDFIHPKIATFISAIVATSYIFFAKNPTILIVMLFLAVSFLVEWLYLLIINRGMGSKRRWKLKNRTFRKLIRQTGPVIFNAIIFQVSLMISSTLATFLGKGYVSAIGYSNQILSIIQALILVNMLSLAYPTLLRLFTQDISAAKRQLLSDIERTNILVIPLVIGMIVLGKSFTALLFQRGEFGADDTALVSQFLIVLALSLPALVIRDFLYRAFFALNDTKTPSKISLFAIALNIIFLAICTPMIGIAAVIVAPIIANSFSMIVAFGLLQKKIGSLKLGTTVRNHLLIVINSVVMAGVILFLNYYWDAPLLLEFSGLTLVGIVVYAILTVLTNPSARTIFQIKKGK